MIYLLNTSPVTSPIMFGLAWSAKSSVFDIWAGRCYINVCCIL